MPFFLNLKYGMSIVVPKNVKFNTIMKKNQKSPVRNNRANKKLAILAIFGQHFSASTN